MIICSCRVISDREIRAAVVDGARRCGDIFRRCGNAPQCGTCLPTIRQMLASAVAPDRPVLAGAD
ncbi:hypothetical protein STAQ_36830 [Allostella sp. ATCC 35155]|nr:hypothetical protein STAQ_36830 [Stella sp. ATCC 35155]